MSLDDVLKLMSVRYFRRRLDPDYFSRSKEYRPEMVEVLKEMGKTSAFWMGPESRS
ncbi:hypothetical protein ACFL2Q_08555 [Thermodesulfobacteriota bacterium]